MTQAPAGWHPDPAGTPGALRYWDGMRWTEHTHHGYTQPSYPAYATQGTATTTPDGQPLAGWWARVGATLIDDVVITLIGVAVTFPLFAHLFRAFRTFFHASITATDNGTTPPSALTFEIHHLGTVTAISAICLAVNLIYGVGFLKWKQATPGKLALGLRVRLREAPGPLSWRTVGLHWAGQYGPSVIGLVPFVGSVTGLYALLDSLWPLWDDNRQALHDKLAKTNVVVQRR